MLRETDYVQQLAGYIKKNLSKGYTLESLKWALVKQGYSRSAVDKAISLANQQLTASAPKMQEKPVIKYEAIEVEAQEVEEKKGFWRKLKSIFRKSK